MIVASFVPAECPKGGGYVGYIRKALEKGYLEHPGLHVVLTVCLRFFVFFGQCLCCLLAVLSTDSHHVRIQILLPSAVHLEERLTVSQSVP